MQMLGKTISDLSGIEHSGSVAGLGLLPIGTIMQTEKVTRNSWGEMATEVLFGQLVTHKGLAGYEIHIGHTDYKAGAKHFSNLACRDEPSNTNRDGCVSSDTRIFGTYLHGIFEEDSFRHQFLTAARGFHRLSPPCDVNPWKQLREDSLNRLAHAVESALDMRTIFTWAGLPYDPHISEDMSAPHRSAGVAR
jgi:adenosylcobyric acid synthase